VGAIDVVAITQEIGCGFVTREGFNQLSSRPLYRGMLGYTKVHHPSAVVGQDQQHKQSLVYRCRDREEIEGYQVLHMILQKVFHAEDKGRFGYDTSPPSIWPRQGQACATRRPSIVRPTSDWSATSRGSTPVGPGPLPAVLVRRRGLAVANVPETVTLPGDDGPGLDEGECVLPASPERGMLGPEEPISGMKLWSVDRLLVNGQLMLKRQDLQVQRRV
jgi:hypothetical protein